VPPPARRGQGIPGSAWGSSATRPGRKLGVGYPAGHRERQVPGSASAVPGTLPRTERGW